jgi:hypothetical protein
VRSLAPLGMTVVDLARPIAASAVATTRANADRATTIEGKNGKGVRPGDERLSNSISLGASHTQGRFISQLYGLFTTTFAAGLFTSSRALTFWI